jgi:MFS family permease
MGTMSLRYSEPLTMRFGPRATLIPGLISIGAGLLLFARTPVDGNYVVDITPAMVLIGLGAGLSFPALMTLAMSGATPQDAGLASGLVNATVQIGGAIGLAVLATLATDRTEGLRGDGESAAAALNGGYHFAYLIGSVLVAVAVVAAVTLLRDARPPAAAAEHAQHGAHPSGRPAFSEAA